MAIENASSSKSFDGFSVKNSRGLRMERWSALSRLISLSFLQNQALPEIPGKITVQQMKMASPQDVFIQNA